MASQMYYSWDDLGRPWRKATPIAELEAWAKANNIKALGTIGNDDHLKADWPQDHTPYSATAWPVSLDGWVVTAIDLENKNGLGQAIEDDARIGKYPWLKYMNHSGQHLDSRDLDGDGKTWEEYPSSDQHVHLSIRTDYQNKSIISTFDPFGTGGNDMELIKAIQSALRDAGFDPGPVDGLWGPRTQAAFTAALRPTPGPKGDPGSPGAPGRVPTQVTFGPITASVTATQ